MSIQTGKTLFIDDSPSREELSAAYSELKKVERTREGMLAVLNHELRTPLCLAKAAAESIESEESSPDGIAARKLLHSGLGRLERAVADILLHARLAGGAALEKVEDVDLELVVAEAARGVAAEAAVRCIRIDLPPHGNQLIVRGDRVLLLRAVGHLLSNAVHFNRPGGWVHVRTTSDDLLRELTVSDEGGGIPPEELGRVFDPYYQIADFMTRSHGGLGLGLAIVRAVFESHGGGVRGINRPKMGCEFRAWVPTPAAGSMQ
jgi:signal transduction histidine kinase